MWPGLLASVRPAPVSPDPKEPLWQPSQPRFMSSHCQKVWEVNQSLSRGGHILIYKHLGGLIKALNSWGSGIFLEGFYNQIKLVRTLIIAAIHAVFLVEAPDLMPVWCFSPVLQPLSFSFSYRLATFNSFVSMVKYVLSTSQSLQRSQVQYAIRAFPVQVFSFFLLNKSIAP